MLSACGLGMHGPPHRQPLGQPPERVCRAALAGREQCKEGSQVRGQRLECDTDWQRSVGEKHFDAARNLCRRDHNGLCAVSPVSMQKEKQSQPTIKFRAHECVQRVRYQGNVAHRQHRFSNLLPVSGAQRHTSFVNGFNLRNEHRTSTDAPRVVAAGQDHRLEL